MPTRLLFISPEFYGTEKRIKTTLEDSGYEVIWIENKTLLFDYHGTESKLRFLRRLRFLLLSPQKRYIRKEFVKISNLKFDILFSINANTACPWLFRRLKAANPRLRSVLYLWDSSSRFNWSAETKFFERVYTFDQTDARKYGYIYKPNFYIENCRNVRSENKYDLFFAGKFTPQRLNIIDRLIINAGSADLNYFIILWPAYKVLFHNYLIYSLLKNIKTSSAWIENYVINFEATEGILQREYLVKNCLSYGEIQGLALSSNVILDIQSGHQSGYSHRVIEALANGKKVITTNKNIVKEVFYNPEQVHILDPDNLNFEMEWIKKRSLLLHDGYFEKLELMEWIKSLINDEISKDQS